MIKYVHAWGKDGVKEMHTPGVEPGSQAWEACMMPLHYVCYDNNLKNDFIHALVMPKQ